MAFIAPGGGGTSIQGSKVPGKGQTVAPLTQAGTVTGAYPDWHKALLWFLGGVALVALASPAPNIATLIVVIIIVNVLLANWSDYSMFLGLANQVTQGSTGG